MGIRGLLLLINENKDRVCTKAVSIKGKLIVDGFALLHDLYDNSKLNLDWGSGGCFADQHKATKDFFEALTNAGVEPIVVLGGGGSKTDIRESIHRRNRFINEKSEELKQYHTNQDHSMYISHHLPQLARQVYISSLKELGIDLYIADGKAHSTIVSLANHYCCPVLANNTNYCVSGIAGGVIITEYLDIIACKAIIYKQTELVHFLQLCNSDLIFAIVAIMGDGCETSLPYLYHGRIKKEIIARSQYKDIELRGKSWIFHVVDFLKDRNIKSFLEFQRRLKSFNFGGQCQALAQNCLTAQEVYDLSACNLSIDILKTTTTIKCSGSGVGDLPQPILQRYRVGEYPVLVINAIAHGEGPLDAIVGDPEQSQVHMHGLPIRQVMYGLVSSLISHRWRRCITEYHRSESPPWEYKPKSVQMTDKYPELSVDKIFDLDDTERKELAKCAMCDILQSPTSTLSMFEKDLDHVYVLASLTTHYWAKSLLHSQHLQHPEQLIQALILNFFFCPGEDRGRSGPILYTDPMWIKVYHALLEWQSLYHDVCCLNLMLCSPFLELPLTNIFDGPFVMELALNPSPDIILTYQARLSKEKKDLYTKIIDMVAV